MSAMSVTVKQGALYLSSELYARYFAGLEAVILLRREADLYVLPVRHAAAGGYLLKVRNKAGDRVVDAPDFFRENGFLTHSVRELLADWSNDDGALVVAAAFDL